MHIPIQIEVLILNYMYWKDLKKPIRKNGAIGSHQY